MTHQLRGFCHRKAAPLLIILMLLCGVAAKGQGTYTPVYNYGYEWQRGNFLHALGFPGDTTRPHASKINNPHWGYKNGQAYFWDPVCQCYKPAGGGVTDTILLATRARLYNALDSLVSSLPTPNLQAVTNAGNTTTQTVYAGGFVTGSYKALLYEGGGSAWLDLKDEADNVTVKLRGAGSGGRGEVTTEALEFPANLPAPPNEYNAGSWYVYRRADTLRAFKDGVEYNLIGGGGTGSSNPTLSTITYSAAPKFDYAVHGTHAKITLTGNASLGFLNLPAHVEYFTLEVIQDATGGRTLSIPASVQILGGNAAYSLTATGGAVDILTFYWNGATLYMNYGKDYKY